VTIWKVETEPSTSSLFSTPGHGWRTARLSSRCSATSERRRGSVVDHAANEIRLRSTRYAGRGGGATGPEGLCWEIRSDLPAEQKVRRSGRATREASRGRAQSERADPEGWSKAETVTRRALAPLTIAMRGARTRNLLAQSAQGTGETSNVDV
jgi:hypothetical protein